MGSAAAKPHHQELESQKRGNALPTPPETKSLTAMAARLGDLL